MTLEERIKKHEGYMVEPYTDTLGFLTGGYGHKILEGEEVPQIVIDISKLSLEADRDANKALEAAAKLSIESEKAGGDKELKRNKTALDTLVNIAKLER